MVCGWVKPTHVLVLFVGATVFMVKMTRSGLPWALPVLFDTGLFVYATIIAVMMVVTMPGTIMSNFEPLLSFAIRMLDLNVGSPSALR